MTRKVFGAWLLVFAALTGCVSVNPKVGVSGKDAARANVQLGVAYMQQGNLLLAKEKLERAEKQDPRNLELHTAMALLSERLGKNDDAARHYQAALRLDPQSAVLANTYAVFQCKAGKVDEAVELFDRAANDGLYNTPWVALTNGALCLRSNKRGADAVSRLDRALALRPDYVSAVVELGDLHIELGHADQAKAVVDRYVLLGRKSPEVLLVGVRAALANGDKNAADDYARRLRRDHPNSAQARSLAQLLRDRG
jgi:type IV pilus assembly protein PilF